MHFLGSLLEKSRGRVVEVSFVIDFLLFSINSIVSDGPISCGTWQPSHLRSLISLKLTREVLDKTFVCFSLVALPHGQLDEVGINLKRTFPVELCGLSKDLISLADSLKR